MSSSGRRLAAALAVGRLAIGTAIWLAPAQAGRALGFRLERPQERVLADLAATRDVALGALALSALGERERLEAVTLLNACVDAGDAVAFARALVRREGIDGAAALGAAAGAAGAAAGVAAVAALRRG